YCFFTVDKPYVVNINEGSVRYFLSVIFWGNLNIIDPNKTHDFTGELVKDVVKRLERNQAGDMQVEENPERIFPQYTALSQEANQYLLKRYTAFKISFWIKGALQDDCIPDAPNVCDINIERVKNLPADCLQKLKDEICECPEPEP